jgi:superfamily II DNA or RNA helicase
MEFKAGSLVRARERDWVVLPSHDSHLLLLKPLGGSEEELTGIYLPLGFEEDQIKSSRFPMPSPEDMGDISSARLLYNATRLAFRNGAGPFRSLAKLSFRPRSYQMVPLIMALRQSDPVRLLIADDVGVGKTIEALLILKEMLERREIKRFAVIVLPHLCEQWQAELKDKFGIEAVIIRSNTQARLDRAIHGDASVYDYYPYQVISVDYIKAEGRRQVFVQNCPDLVIVDEAHTCSHRSGTVNGQQQRNHLIHAISQKPGQHLILLTATPHSGKTEQFNSLLGLINPAYQTLDLPNASQKERGELARFYVQRRRADVEKWMNENTPFPKREAGEFQYELSQSYETFYETFYEAILEFALGLTRRKDGHEGQRRMRYWSALALLRGVMSSPSAGVEMLRNRIAKMEDEAGGDDEESAGDNPLMDDDFSGPKDFAPVGILNKTDWTTTENKKLSLLAGQLDQLQGIKTDFKAAQALEIIKSWISEGYSPVIFCRFIRTAAYLGEILKQGLQSLGHVEVQAITSEDPDEVRKARIDDMKAFSRKVLVATDCLSEGINLQDQFTAVLHYDLPWNPNRLEQREGRIDRYGQTAGTIKAYLLYGKNNPIDGVVLKVLLRKVREIRKSIGISIPFPEDSQSLMDAVLQAVLSDPRILQRKQDRKQMLLDFGDFEAVIQKEIIATNAIQKAADREKASRTIFAQNAIKADEIEADLKQSDEAIGDPAAVEAFVAESLKNLLGVQITRNKGGEGYTLYPANLPDILKTTLPQTANPLNVSFYSPTPEGYLYLGRNHAFVEQLCRFLMANSLNGKTEYGPARAAVIKSGDVDIKTTLLLFRVRNVIQEKGSGTQFVAEEMLLWGYRGNPWDHDILKPDAVRTLMETAAPTANLSPQARAAFLTNELENISELQDTFDAIALKRSEMLVQAHERFRKVMGGKRYQAVEPVLPMDVMGMYILLPDNGL